MIRTNYLHQISTLCCEPSGFSEDEINGECPACGVETVDGEAYDQCGYSEVICETCISAPCDGSC